MEYEKKEYEEFLRVVRRRKELLNELNELENALKRFAYDTY